MFALQRSESSTNPDTIAMNFLDSAAALEECLHESELEKTQLQERLRDKEQLLEEQHQLGHRRQTEIRAWLIAIRRQHRTGSHAATTRLIKLALASLEAGRPISPLLF